jgi:hypothetical protein
MVRWYNEVSADIGHVSVHLLSAVSETVSVSTSEVNMTCVLYAGYICREKANGLVREFRAWPLSRT